MGKSRNVKVDKRVFGASMRGPRQLPDTPGNRFFQEITGANNDPFIRNWFRQAATEIDRSFGIRPQQRPRNQHW